MFTLFVQFYCVTCIHLYTEFEKIVLERLTKLEQLVTELLRRSGGINISIPSKIKLHKIPVETVDEFQSLNAWIKAVPENRDCLVRVQN